MRLRKARPLVVAELLVQSERKHLVFAILAVLEGQVEETPFVVRHAGIATILNRDPRQPAGDPIGCIRPWRASENIARELIERDDRGEQRTGGGDSGSFVFNELF